MKLTQCYCLSVTIVLTLGCGSPQEEEQEQERVRADTAVRTQLAAQFGADTVWQSNFANLDWQARVISDAGPDPLTIDLQDLLPPETVSVVLTGDIVDAARGDSALQVWFTIDAPFQADAQLDCPLALRDSLKSDYYGAVLVAFLSGVTPVLDLSRTSGFFYRDRRPRSVIHGRCVMIRPLGG